MAWTDKARAAAAAARRAKATTLKTTTRVLLAMAKSHRSLSRDDRNQMATDLRAAYRIRPSANLGSLHRVVAVRSASANATKIVKIIATAKRKLRTTPPAHRPALERDIREWGAQLSRERARTRGR